MNLTIQSRVQKQIPETLVELIGDYLSSPAKANFAYFHPTGPINDRRVLTARLKSAEYLFARRRLNNSIKQCFIVISFTAVSFNNFCPVVIVFSQITISKLNQFRN